MKKFWFQLIALLIVIFGTLFVIFQLDLFNSSEIPNQQVNSKTVQIIDATSTPQIKLVKAQLKVEVADTKEKRTKGLANRDFLATDSGMLFVFDKAQVYQFWMKGLKFPLDFIWIANLRIVDILTKVDPPLTNAPDESLPRYAPVVPIDMVLEVNSGFVAEHNIRVGDRIIFEE